MSTTCLTVPYFFGQFGVLQTAVFMVLCAGIHLLMDHCIYLGSHDSRSSNFIVIGTSQYPPNRASAEPTRTSTPHQTFGRIYRVTLLLDYASGVLISFVVSWNVLLYLGLQAGYFSEQLLDRKQLEFDQRDPVLIRLRGLYVCAAAVCLIPLFLRRSFHSLSVLVKYFSLYTFFLYLVIMVSLGVEKKQLAEHTDIRVYLFPQEPFGLRTLTIWYTLLSCFYIQPYVLTYKRNLLSRLVIPRPHDPETLEVPETEPGTPDAAEPGLRALLLRPPGRRQRAPGDPDQALLLQ